MQNKEIAQRLGLAVATVSGYLDAARNTLGVRSRVGLALRWNDYRRNQVLKK